MKISRRLPLALLIVSLLGAGCAGLHSILPFTSQPAFTEEELREELVIFSARFAGVVSSAGDQIREENEDPLIRQRALLWRIRLVPVIQEATFLEDPQEAYVTLLTGVGLMRRYLEVGDGREIFGPGQPIAVEATRALYEDALDIGRHFLDEAQMLELEQEVRTFVTAREMGGMNFSVPSLQRVARDVRSSGRFDWVVSIPMSPFRALEGVGSGASAMHDLNDTALRFTGIVQGLPEQIRWQTQLMLYDLESRGPIHESLAALESFARTADRLSEAIDRLPDDIRTILEDSRGPIGDANQALLSVNELLGPLAVAAEQVSLAGDAWAQLAQGDGSSEPDPDSRPFDIREYEATARGIGEAAVELQQLTAKLTELAASPVFETTLGGVSSALVQAETGGRGVVDHAAWRGLQLLIAFFVLLAGYRLLSSRFAK